MPRSLGPHSYTDNLRAESVRTELLFADVLYLKDANKTDNSSILKGVTGSIVWYMFRAPFTATSFTTTDSSGTVRIRTAGHPTLLQNDTVYMDTLSLPSLNGIPRTMLLGAQTVSAVGDDYFEIVTSAHANTTSTLAASADMHVDLFQHVNITSTSASFTRSTTPPADDGYLNVAVA